jgi:hypothetical protein
MHSALQGPYDLTFDVLERKLPARRAGAFALGHTDEDGTFRVKRVGRSDADLRRTLQDLIGSSNKFKFVVTASAREAFDRECELFHKFRPPSNFTHPDRPRGSDWRCPRCFLFHL